MDKAFEALNISFATAFGVAILLLSVSELLGLVDSPTANGLVHALLLLCTRTPTTTDVPELARRPSIHGVRSVTPSSIYSLDQAELYDSEVSNATTILARATSPTRTQTPQ